MPVLLKVCVDYAQTIFAAAFITSTNYNKLHTPLYKQVGFTYQAI